MNDPNRSSVRVLVVDDSELFRDALVRLYEEDSEFRVVGIAATAKEGVALAISLGPDVISLDLGLPDADGFEVTRLVMAERPTPIMVLTATLNPSWRREAYHALTLGAIDVTAKPTAEEFTDPRWRQRLRGRLRVVARSPVVPHILSKVRARLRGGVGAAVDATPSIAAPPTAAPSCSPHCATGPAASIHSPAPPDEPEIVPAEPAVLPSFNLRRAPGLLAIVGSAGSPLVVSEMLSILREGMPLRVPVIVVLHLGHMMGTSLARYFHDEIAIDAQPLRDNDRPEPGTVYVAPGGTHIEFRTKRRIRLFSELPASYYRPNIDHFLWSVAKHYEDRAIGVILTGMGEDGAQGLLQMRRCGAVTLAQDDASCLVPGMPRAANAAGAVSVVLPPRQIACVLLRELHGS